MSFQEWPVMRDLDPSFLETVRVALVFENNVILVADDKKIHGYGSNMLGCLGMKNKARVSNPQIVPDLEDKDFIGIACGGDFRNNLFVVAHFRGGEIYQWGKLPCWRTLVLGPQRVDNFMNIKIEVLACGVAHCAVLSYDGQVFTWGANDVGQLGHNECKVICSLYGTRVPCRVKGILEEKRVVDISCGGRFSATVLEDGQVVTWGSNSHGQLGKDNNLDCSSVPIHVELVKECVIKKVACGRAYVLAITETNDFLGWGDNSSSQLGFSNSPNAEHTHLFAKPFDDRITNPKKFVDIYASYACDLSVGQCEDGKFFMWGSTSSGKGCLPRDSGCTSIHQLFAFHARPCIMPKPLKCVLEVKRRKTAIETYEQAFNNPDTSDFVIIAEGKKIYVHRTILKLRSEYFNTMLCRWLSENQNEITIKNKIYAVIEAYLWYLYSDKVNINVDFARELLQLADEYADEDFKSLCEMKMRHDMTLEKVARLLDLLKNLPTFSDLNKYCLDIAMRHPVEIINSPGFKNWDASTSQFFLIEYVKKMKSQSPDDFECSTANCLCRLK